MKKYTFTFISALLFASSLSAQVNNGIREYTISEYTEYVANKDANKQDGTKKDVTKNGSDSKKEKNKKEKSKKKEKVKADKTQGSTGTALVSTVVPQDSVSKDSTKQQKNQPRLLDELSISGRMAYEYHTFEGTAINRNIGFKGQYVYLNVGGNIMDIFTYRYSQRLDNIGKVNFFDAMEELNITWNALKILHVSGGKQHIALGGFEYNTAPVDMYYNSEFWYQFYPFMSQFGGSIDVDVSKYDNIAVQLTNSPFYTSQLGNIYCGSFLWTSHHGFYSSRWSWNLMQSKAYQGAPKQYTNYIVLGNRFDITPNIYITLDLMNRSSVHGIPSGFTKIKIADDYSITSEVSVRPMKNMRTYAKYTRDVNKGTEDDKLVQVGTEMNTASIGVEYDALKHRMGGVRVFANGLYNWGKTDNKMAEHAGGEIRVQVGVKLSIDVLGCIMQ